VTMKLFLQPGGAVPVVGCGKVTVVSGAVAVVECGTVAVVNGVVGCFG
jgi:hypothetical protein